MNRRTANILLIMVLQALTALGWATLPEEAWTIGLQPVFSPGTPPAWANGARGQPAMDGENALLVPLPATASMDDDACLVVTVVFDDKGDGGPVVEWIAPEGDAVLLSAGIGETGVAPGPNARTLLLAQSMTLDGGTLRISHAGRMQRLISVTVRLAAACPVASLSTSVPALVDSALQARDTQDTSGESFVPRRGDRTKGQVVDAELSPANLRLDTSEAEFVIPVSRPPAGAVLSAQIAGLDPESRIEVCVNGSRYGMLSPYPVALDDPSAIISPQGKLILAGWRRAALLLPASLWHSGENTVSLRLHRAPGDPGNPVYSRDVRIGALFAPVQSGQDAGAGTERLSTGSEFVAPRPDAFRAGIPPATGP